MEEQKPDLEIVPKKPTYTKFEAAYGKLRNAERDLLNHNYNTSIYDAGRNGVWREVPLEKQSKYFVYDDKPFKEIQANVKHPFPTNIKYDTTTNKFGELAKSTPNKDTLKLYPKSEYAIRQKAIADEIADQDKDNEAEKKVDAGGYVEERYINEDGDEDDEDGMNDEEAWNHFKDELDRKPYKTSSDLYYSSPDVMSTKLLNKGPHPTGTIMHQDGKLIPPKKRKTRNIFEEYSSSNPLQSSSDFEKIVNTPLSKYYKYVNDDDHWVNPNVVDLDKEPNKEGNK